MPSPEIRLSPYLWNPKVGSPEKRSSYVRTSVKGYQNSMLQQRQQWWWWWCLEEGFKPTSVNSLGQAPALPCLKADHVKGVPSRMAQENNIENVSREPRVLSLEILGGAFPGPCLCWTGTHHGGITVAPGAVLDTGIPRPRGHMPKQN